MADPATDDDGYKAWAANIAPSADGALTSGVPSLDATSEDGYKAWAANAADGNDLNAGGPHKVPTQFKKSVTPPPAPVPVAKGQKGPAPVPAPEKELTLGQTAHQAIQNFIPSVGQNLSNMAGAVLHPIKTVQAIGSLGAGLVSQGLGAVGVQQDAKTKAATEASANALEAAYAQKYGSIAGFKKAFATDPAGVLTDLSSVFDLGASGVGIGANAVKIAANAAKAGDLASAASKVGKIAKVAGHVGSAVDPTQAVIRGVTHGAGYVGQNILQHGAGLTTGLGSDVFKMASDVAKNPVPNKAYKRAIAGKTDATDAQGALKAAIGQVAQDASDAHAAGIQKMADEAQAAGRNVSYTPIQDAIQKARAKMEIAPGVADVGYDSELNALNNLDQKMQIKAANGAQPTFADIDGLKQGLYRHINSTPLGMSANNPLADVYGAAKQTLTNAHPDYGPLMDKWQDHMANLKDLQTQLGANTMPHTAMARMLRTTKTPSGQSLLKQVAAKNPKLPGMIAGTSLRPLASHGQTLADTLGGTALDVLGHAALHGGAAGMLGGIPGLVGGAALGLASSSPRLAGAANRAVGLAKDVTNNVAPWVARGAYYGTRQDALDNDVDAPDDTPEAVAPPAPAKGAVPASQAAALAATVKDPAAINAAIKGAEGTPKNPRSSAVGPYQLTDPTFIASYRHAHPEAQSMTNQEILALRHSDQGAAISEDLGPRLTSENTAGLAHAGYEGHAANVYLAHVLGLPTAKSILAADPDAPASDIISRKVLDANPRFKKFTVGDLKDWAASTIGQQLARQSYRAGGAAYKDEARPEDQRDDEQPQAAEEPRDVLLEAPGAEQKNVDDDDAANREPNEEAERAQGHADVEQVHRYPLSKTGTLRAPTKMSSAEQVNYYATKLMKAAKAAKRHADSATEPLLKAPDAAIAKALAIAQEAI